ncbi:MAG: glycosyltransferase family 2 protein [Bacteroidetes bacterium]|nr:glycosyltransferase family 2 protein [Bacteroidota bacterium]
MNLSVIIPIYNEEGNIKLLYERLTSVVGKMNLSYELVFVNDGSKDSSLEIIKQYAAQHPEIKYINLSRNFGHQIAVSAGIDNVVGNAVVIIDADLQDPPELIEPMYKMLNEGYQVVYAKRKQRKGESLLKLITAKLFYRTIDRLTDIDIPLDTGDFRIMDKRVVDVLKLMPEKHKFLRAQISWIGFKQGFVTYDRDERHAGKTGYTFSKMFRFALDGITAFSSTPLRLASYAGFVVSGITFLLMIYALVSKFVYHDVIEGWTSLILCVLFIGGIQLLVIGIIGEYIGRMADNIRNRPLYIIGETNIKKE